MAKADPHKFVRANLAGSREHLDFIAKPNRHKFVRVVDEFVRVGAVWGLLIQRILVGAHGSCVNPSTFSPLTPALSPLRGEGEELGALAQLGSRIFYGLGSAEPLLRSVTEETKETK